MKTVLLLSIAILYLWRIGSTEVCYKIQSDFTGNVVTGYPTIDQKSCQCTDTTYTKLLANYFCFCANSISSSVASTCSVCGTLPLYSNSSETCEINSFMPGYRMHGFSKFDILIEGSPLATNEQVEMTSESVTGGFEKQYSFQLSDGLYIPFSSEDGLENTFFTPGYHYVIHRIQNNYTAPVTVMKWFDVGSYINGTNFKKPSVFVTNKVMAASLIILHGSNLTLKISVTVTENAIDKTPRVIDIKADIPTYGFGPQSDFLSTYVHHNPNMEPPTDKSEVYTSNILTITESGSLTSVEIFALTPGVLFLLVLSPKCGEGIDYCFKTQKCGCTDEEKLTDDYEEITPGVINSLVMNNFFVKKHILLNVSTTGYLHLNIKSHEIKIDKGDQIAYVDTGRNSKLPLISAGGISTPYKTSKINNADTALDQYLRYDSLMTLDDTFLGLRVYVSKPLIYDLTEEAQSQQGTVTYEIDIENHFGKEHIGPTKVPIEEEIMGLAFVPGKPTNASIGAYNTKDKWIEMAVTLTHGTNVNYMFHIPELGKMINRTNIGKMADVMFEITEVGEFTCNVIAWNNINQMNTSIKFSILAKIENHLIMVSNPFVEVSKDFIIFVNVIDGTGVNLEVDFGDGTPVITQFIDDATSEKGVFHNFTHRYTSCDTFNITAKVENFISTSPKENFTMISSTCPLTFVNITTLPQPIESGEVLLPLSADLEVDIDLNNGSWPVYTIFWGDSKSERIDHQKLDAKPKILSMAHRYTEEGNFTVRVEVANPLTQITSRNVLIVVTRCSLPVITFTYGSPNNRFTITRGDTQKFLARWEYPDNECSATVKNSLKFLNFVLHRKSDNSKQRNDTGANMELGQIQYILTKMTRDAGDYDLTLNMEFDGSPVKYTAYIRIIQSPIVAMIQNGDSLKVGILKTEFSSGNSTNATYYNFTLDAASVTYDPDARRDKVNGMIFEWACKLNATESVVNTSRKAKAFVNATYEEMCTTSNFKTINLNTVLSKEPGKVMFNTEMFLENVVYWFRVKVMKGTRNGSYIQRILFLPGAPPNVKLVCVSNCGEKLNSMERVVIKYECKSCPIKPSIVGNWKILDGAGVDLTAGLLNTTVSSTGPGKPNLVINPFFFGEGKRYRLTLEVGFAGSTARSTYNRDVLTSTKPYGGDCSIRKMVLHKTLASKISPLNGTAAKTKFKIKCRNWENTDQPTKYEFRYNNGLQLSFGLSSVENEDSVLLNPNSGDLPTVSDVLLPTGNPSYNYTIRIIVRVINKYGAYAEDKSLKVKVIEPEVAKTSNTSQLFESLLEDKPKTNDAQSNAAYVSAGMSLVNEKASTVENKETKKEEDDFNDIPDPNKVKQLEEEKQQFLEQQQNYISNMVGVLKETEVKSFQEIKSIADALTTMTKDPRGLTETSESDTIDIVSKLADKLEFLVDDDNSDSIGANSLDQNSKPLVTTISQLFESSALKLETSVKEQQQLQDTNNNQDLKVSKRYVSLGSNRQKAVLQVAVLQYFDGFYRKTNAMNAFLVKQQDVNQTQTKKNIKSLDVVLDKYLTTISKNKVSGEAPSMGKTASFTFSVQRTLASDLSDRNITTSSDSNDNEFRLPDSADMFNDTVLRDEITILNLVQNKNPYTWDKNASFDIRSEVPSLSFKVSNQEVIVQNTKNPINIKIKNKLDDFKTENVSLYIPGLTVFKEIGIKTKDCHLLVNIKALNDFDHVTNLIVYIQYGKAPGESDHDVKLNISQNNGIDLKVNKGLVTLGGNNQTNITSVNETLTTANKTVQRFSNIRLIDDSTLMMWDLPNSTYGYLNKSVVYFAFTYEGPMPDNLLFDNPYTYDVIEIRGAFNYSLKTFCSECRYWSEAHESWKSDGCELNQNETNLQTTSCQCNHLTSFGGFYVAPNPIKTPTLDMLKDGYVLLVTVCSVLLLYVVGLVFARRADRKDSTKVGVCPLLDNRPDEHYLYEVTVNTGSRRNAGTTSNIFFTAVGDEGESGFRRLKDAERLAFQRASSDVFVMTTAKCMGDISYIRIWHDNTGGGWYLRSLEIVDLQTEEKYVFLASRWLAVDKGDGQLDCVVPASSPQELSEFNYLFTNKTRRDFSDAHIWFSVYARPPRSPFTRCQRLSVAVSLLFTAMVASLMFYGALPEGKASEQNKIGSFSFTWRQVFIALISACITVPVNLILVGIFRSVRPVQPNLIEASSEESLSEESFEMTAHSPTGEKLIKGTDSSRTRSKKTSVHLIVQPLQPASTENTVKTISEETTPNQHRHARKLKEPFYLPHWCIYPAWLLCVLVILGSAVIVVLYGMTFGNKKSLEWLASVTICLIQDILLLQPLKVFAMALFIALVVKKLDDEEKSEVEKQVKSLAKNEKWMHKVTNETSIFDRVDTSTLNPPDNDKIQSMRALRLKEVKMYAISRELIIYLIFTLIVFTIGFLTRDQFAFNQTRDIEELLRLHVRNKDLFDKQTIFKEVQSYNDFWPWVDKMLLEQIYPAKWYNLSKRYENTSKSDFPGKLYLNDLGSKILNGVRLRQVRVKPDSCQTNKDVSKYISIDCADTYGPGDEEERDFDYDWNKPIKSNEYLTPKNKPWRYQSWKDLDAYPIFAELGTYYGGGYVIEIFPKWDNRLAIDTLKAKRWINRHTRAVIVEMTLYNAGTNYFDSVMIVFEFPPSGGVIPYYSVVTFKLYRYTSGYAFITIVCEVAFLLFMLLFFIREMKLIYREKWTYFKEFWNLVELSNFLLSVLAVGFYFYRDKLASDLLGRVPDKRPEKFINFQFAANFDLLFTYIVALICFFVTLKFIKLLRFNKRISLLSSTLKAAWYPLAMFSIAFIIVISAVVSATTIIFGKTLYGYRTNLKTIASIISLLLGKFSYYQFEESNRILGPIFFFMFNIMVNWVIMNMMISILNDVFAEVQNNISDQNNDYEMVDFIMDHFKSWVGLSGRQHDNAAEDAWEQDHSAKTSERKTSSRISVTSRRIQRRRSSRMNRKSQTSFTSLREKSRRSLRSEYSFSEGFGELKKSKHYEEKDLFQNRDLSCLKIDNESINDDEVNETVNKFINCVNLLYFDDDEVAKKMNDVVKNEMKC